MPKKLENAKISDILINELYFYNHENRDILKEFCKVNSITFLPDKNQKAVFELMGDEFVRRNLNPEYCISPDKKLLDEETLKKFENNPEEIRFVIENDKIIGVVHIVDYNNEFIQIEIFRLLFRFENNLRKLLRSRRFDNDDFIEWVKLKAEKSEYWSERYERIMPEDPERRNRIINERQENYAFQTFNLSELLIFSFEKGVLNRDKIYFRDIKKIRNSIAHRRHLTPMNENEEGYFVYNFEELRNFISSLKNFFQAYKYLESLYNTSEYNLLLKGLKRNS